MINSVVCFVNEKTGIVYIEKVWDSRMKESKEKSFNKMIEESYFKQN